MWPDLNIRSNAFSDISYHYQSFTSIHIHFTQLRPKWIMTCICVVNKTEVEVIRIGLSTKNNIMWKMKRFCHINCFRCCYSILHFQLFLLCFFFSVSVWTGASFYFLWFHNKCVSIVGGFSTARHIWFSVLCWAINCGDDQQKCKLSLSVCLVSFSCGSLWMYGKCRKILCKPCWFQSLRLFNI